MVKLLCALVLLAGFVSAETVLTITKTPYEVFSCSVDFSQAVGSSNIALAGVTAKDASGNDASVTIIAANPIPAVVPSTSKVAFSIQGGTPGISYTASVKVTNSATGEQFEGTIVIRIAPQ